MEVFRQWKAFGLYFYVSSIRMKRRRSVDEKLRNKDKTLRKCKKSLYAEQGGCCADCGEFLSMDGLEIHHLVGVSEAPNLMLAKGNMVLLCPKCHRGRHRGGKSQEVGLPRGGSIEDKEGNEKEKERENDGELQ
ncbi:MAG: HNH endonuclease [Bacteroidaceae bacterium]|nr:HNH endonuclease [Bacteroidaceae bacterium]